MKFVYNDGGRSKYFKATQVGDCVVRAAAIATQRDYKEVYELARKIAKGTPRNGMSKTQTKRLMETLGGRWEATMTIGSGCKVHLRDGELPDGRIVCSLSGHVVAVINGVVNDTYEDDRNGTRCVYGYWKFQG